MRLKEVLKSVPVIKQYGADNPEINQIELNSALIGKGGLFVAVKGLKTDGHRYINLAIENGAIAVVCENIPKDTNENVAFVQVNNSRKSLALLAKSFYRAADDKLIKIAVTGTNGKTSTVYFVRQLLNLLGHKCGLIGTIEYDTGNKVIAASHTTPEVHIIQRLFAEMNQNGCEFCVMEVSSHGLALNRLDEITFQRAVFTNLSQDHLDFHYNFDAYFKAKETLFSNHLKGIAILNTDDKFAARISAKPRITFSISSDSDLKIATYSLSSTGTRFSVQYKNENYSFETSILGHYNLYNILGAISVLLSLDIKMNSIQEVVANLKPVPGRMETIPFKDSIAIIDYAHTPDALYNVLKTSRDFCEGRLICVFGCGGDRDRGKRPKMAKAAEEVADVIYVTSDNPRSENPESIIDDIISGFKSKKEINRNSDRKAAIYAALDSSMANDIVVIAGKGHEPYQEINGVRHHFDDRKLVHEWENSHATH